MTVEEITFGRDVGVLDVALAVRVPHGPFAGETIGSVVEQHDCAGRWILWILGQDIGSEYDEYEDDVEFQQAIETVARHWPPQPPRVAA